MVQTYSKKETQRRAKIVENYLRNFKENSTASSTAIADNVMSQFIAVQTRTGIRPEKDASPYYFNGTQVLVVGPICENPNYAGVYNFMPLKNEDVGDDALVFLGRKAVELKVDTEDMVFLEDLIKYNSN
jgi:hypothetical protein